MVWLHYNISHKCHYQWLLVNHSKYVLHCTVSLIVSLETDIASANLFVALHVYSAASPNTRSVIVRLLQTCDCDEWFEIVFLLSLLSRWLSFSQDNSGDGYPLAQQVKVAVLWTRTVVTNGCLSINGGTNERNMHVISYVVITISYNTIVAVNWTWQLICR